MNVENTEIISPEDNFDNGLILGYIEKALSSESRLFTKYNHYEIYELKLSGYSNGEIAEMYNVTTSYISTMINWIELRLRKNLKFLIN
tara:strand:+ start:321 stop:584 length:264 start_codon:yes stop_codon:yes gene_type:complete